MALSHEIPDSIRKEIAIYLGSDERIIKVLSSISERIEAVGEVWLILTNLSVFFFTRRHGREPVVALLALKDIREIEYFEKLNGIALTFVPERNPASSTRLSFPLSRKEALEDFCEDLADLIRFKKETPAGVKTYKQDPVLSSQKSAKAAPEPATKTEASARPAAAAATKPASAAKTLADKKVRIVKTAGSASALSSSSVSSPTKKTTDAQTSKSATAQPDRTAPAQSDKAAPAQSGKSASGQNKVFEPGTLSDNSACLYVIMATSLSILVGFIWYKFFRMLMKRS